MLTKGGFMQKKQRFMRFQKPHPLSPGTKAEYIDGKFRFDRKGAKVAQGVLTSESPFYLWLEYLKRSERYKNVCKGEQETDALKELFKDFGDIFQLETDENGYITETSFYYDWWREKGYKLFGVLEEKVSLELLSVADVVNRELELTNRDVSLVALPKGLSKVELRKALGLLVTHLNVAEEIEVQKPKYQFSGERIDVESLRSCLDAYDCSKHGLSHLEIYYSVIGKHSDIKLEEFFSASKRIRSPFERWVVIDTFEAIEKFGERALNTKKWAAKERAAVELANEKIQSIKNQRFVVRGAEWGNKTRKLSEDELSEYREILIAIELDMVKLSPKAARAKQIANARRAINSTVSRMLKRAKANIDAVERGTFGVTYRGN